MSDVVITGKDEDRKRDNPMLASPVAALAPAVFQELCESVMIIMPRQRMVVGEMMHLSALWGRLGMTFADVVDEHGGNIEVTRALVEKTFLEWTDTHPKVRYLVMMDSDEECSWDAPLRLALHGLPVVSGVVCGFSAQRGIFACFMDYDANGVARFPCYAHTSTLPENGIKKVHGAGTGLMCVRKDVFETILNAGELPFMSSEEIRKESYRAGANLQGEDFSFCEKVRRFGFEIYVDFGVRAYHFKTMKIGWPESGLDEDLDPKDWKPSPLDYKGPR